MKKLPIVFVLMILFSLTALSVMYNYHVRDVLSLMTGILAAFVFLNTLVRVHPDNLAQSMFGGIFGGGLIMILFTDLFSNAIPFIFYFQPDVTSCLLMVIGGILGGLLNCLQDSSLYHRPGRKHKHHSGTNDHEEVQHSHA